MGRLCFAGIWLLGLAAALVCEKEDKRKTAFAMLAAFAAAAVASVLAGFAVLWADMGSLTAAAQWFSEGRTQYSVVAGSIAFVLTMHCLAGRERTERLAPLFLLLLAALRFSEAFCPPAGLGTALEGVPPAFSPLIREDAYGDPCLAVYRLEAAAALLCALTAAVQGRKGKPTLFPMACRLAAWQIFFENLLTSPLMLGFVRTEQILCLLILLAAAFPGTGMRKKPGAWGWIACIAAMGAVHGMLQFAMDKPYLIAEAAAHTDEGFDAAVAAVPVVCHILAALLSVVMGEIAARAGQRNAEGK